MANPVNDLVTRFWTNGSMLYRLISINVVVFIVLLLLSIISKLFIPALASFSDDAFFLATTADLGKLLYRPWTVVTHMFTHQGFFHLFFNMLVLFYFGKDFQDFFGPRKLLATYLLGGLVGFLAFLLLLNASVTLTTNVSAVGASAAVMAVMVGLATYFPDKTFRLMLIGNVKLKWIAIVYVFIDLIGLNGLSNVGGHAGHLGGALYGFLLMYQMRNGKDIGMWFEKLLDRLADLFRKRPKLKVKYSKKEKNSRAPKSDDEYNAEKVAKQKKIDKILDKISKAGYDSLTKSEKDYLFRNANDL
ncbi:MAG: rhomboid family intramembrane serine protease [Flavobacteriales bacterium]|nr:rhomboid family intramembrane serine protease [Flavobacteriales bacterium]